MVSSTTCCHYFTSRNPFYRGLDKMYISTVWWMGLFQLFGEIKHRWLQHIYTLIINYKIFNNIVGESGRLLLTNIELSNIVFSVVNVYAPNDSCNRNIFFQSVLSSIKIHANGIKLIGGDMNDTLTIHDRISSSSQIKKCPVPNLTKIMDIFRLIDVWRLFNPDKTQFIWRRNNGIEQSKIDLWLFDSKY